MCFHTPHSTPQNLWQIHYNNQHFCFYCITKWWSTCTNNDMYPLWQWIWKQNVPPKHTHISRRLHSSTYDKTLLFIGTYLEPWVMEILKQYWEGNMQHAHSTVSNKTGNVHKCKTEGCLCNHHCSEKAISITHSDCVFVALGIQQALYMCLIFMWLAWLHSTFPHYLINGTIF